LRFTYSRKLRLTTADFDQVMKKGVKTVTPFFVFLHLKTENDNNRIGFIIAKKNIGNAVKRNRYRRIIRECFRLNQHRFSHIDIVVIARKVTQESSNADMVTCLNKYWQKLADSSISS